MGHILPFTHRQVPQVALLHARVFGHGQPSAGDLSDRADYLRKVFLRDDGPHDSGRSLVYEAHNRIVGFVGASTRDFRLGGKSISVSISSQFIVDPDSRSHLAGIRLLKEFFQGPQDLSIADEANDAARTVWEGCGGVTAPLYSFYWTRPLRPAAYVLSLLRLRRPWAPVAAALRPFASIVDGMMGSIPRNPWQVTSDLLAESVDSEELWSALSDYYGEQTLRPEYQFTAWQWVNRRAQAKQDCGRLQWMTVKTAGRGAVGWYLYYINPGGTSEVLQLAAKTGSEQAVFHHLLRHAWQGGAAALSGRLQPSWLPVLSNARCLFYRGPWVLVSSKRPELLRPFYEGTASISRLDGEWCLRYR